MLLTILAAVLFVSAISLICAPLILVKDKAFDAIVFLFVSFATGLLLGAAFFHLLPESIHLLGEANAFAYTIVGMLIFFILERYIRWRHCHVRACEAHPFAYLQLLGDGVHNFVDGMLIAASFLIGGLDLGVPTTLAVVAHEVPQELGDFAVIVSGGVRRAKALAYNFASALAAIAGALIVYVSSGLFEPLIPLLIPIAAGNFIYVAGSDLVPELHKEVDVKRSTVQLALLTAGLALTWALNVFVHA